MEKAANRQSDTWAINGVEIVLVQARVYHNGLQQARIRLRVQPTLNGQTVRLSDTERQNIALFDYDASDQHIPFSDDGSTNYRGWSAQRTDRGYTYHPGVRSDDVTPAQGPGEWLDFYVSADQSAGNRSIRLSFTIYGDNGSTWSTTGYMTPPGGGSPEYYAYLDLRENIEVTADPPALYSADNFQLDRRSIIGIGRTEAAPLFNDIVAVSIVAAGGRHVGIRDMRCTPAGMIHWINNLPDTSNPCFTGYARPGETTIYWNSDVPVGSQPLPTLSSPETSRGVFVLCGRIDIRRGNYFNPPQGPLAVIITDEYGTTQNRQIIFVAGQRDELKIV
ncbi:hypothetical protein [Luteibacter sp. Lutesp34]|uniref:hypothetical protein n=1 Tax=Luteibacter sp. Lutesp34 TaxID=3243030 RepID=UPI0039B6B76B